MEIVVINNYSVECEVSVNLPHVFDKTEILLNMEKEEPIKMQFSNHHNHTIIIKIGKLVFYT